MKRVAHFWVDAESWQHTAPARAIPAPVRSLILSKKSLTDELEALYEKRVEVELKQVGYCAIDEELAAYMDVEAGCRGFEREVWLVVGGRRLVYAISQFSPGAYGQ